MTLDTLIQKMGKISRNRIVRPITCGVLALSLATASPQFTEIAGATNTTHQSSHTQNHHSTVRPHRTNYANLPVPKVGYSHVYTEPDLSQITLSDNDSDIGRVERACRWRNITQSVELRYGIPRDYLLAMICQESEGDPTQPNQSGDGGLGLIHMQPLMAEKYGLHMITDSKQLVDRRQGRRIERAIDLHNGDLKDLTSVDDRFHPIKNVDAAGRMLADLYQHTHSWSKALERYAGRGSYDTRVLKYAAKIHSTKFMAKVRRDFANRNNGVSISGKPIDFDRYIRIFSHLNYNYGLQHYKNLARRPVRK
jgi:hypothetical protein